MFSHLVDCLFILLMVSFALQKLFSLMSHLFIFSFVSLVQGVISEKNIAKWDVRDFSMFSSRIFMVLNLTFKSLIFWVYSCVWCNKDGLVSFFYMYLSNFPINIYWIDCLYPIVCSCLLCQILIDHREVGLFLGSLFCSIDLCVCFYTSTMLIWLLWPCSIVLYKVVLYLQLCSFFLNIAEAIQGFLWFHINFWIICCSSVRLVTRMRAVLVEGCEQISDWNGFKREWQQRSRSRN